MLALTGRTTAMTLGNLGIVYDDLKDFKKAYEYQKRTYDIFLKFYGPDHPYTKQSHQQLKKLDPSNNLNSLLGGQSNNSNQPNMQNLLNLLMGLPRNNP